MFELSVIKGFC